MSRYTLLYWAAIPTCGLLAALSGCSAMGFDSNKGTTMTYHVKRAHGPLTIDGNWDKPEWKNAPVAELTHYMGDKPDHFPRTQAKVLYDDKALYVIFRVEDRYVRAVAGQHDDPVCLDSCAEFFFVPGMDLSKGYFNMEMNCGGTMLFHFQVIPRKDSVAIGNDDLNRIEIAHNMPKTVNPEISAPTTWVIEYRLPLDILPKYRKDITKPGPGVTWRANFFKCADNSSHPHWLTWSKVERPRPDFHVPECFGTLQFE